MESWKDFWSQEKWRHMLSFWDSSSYYYLYYSYYFCCCSWTTPCYDKDLFLGGFSYQYLGQNLGQPHARKIPYMLFHLASFNIPLLCKFWKGGLGWGWRQNFNLHDVSVLLLLGSWKYKEGHVLKIYAWLNFFLLYSMDLSRTMIAIEQRVKHKKLPIFWCFLCWTHDLNKQYQFSNGKVILLTKWRFLHGSQS